MQFNRGDLAAGAMGALYADGGLANRVARGLSGTPKWMRANFARATGEESKSPTLWGKLNGVLDTTVRAERLADFVSQNHADITTHLDTWFAQSQETKEFVKRFTVGEMPQGQEVPKEAPSPKPEAPKVPAAQVPVPVVFETPKGAESFAPVWASLGIPQAVQAALSGQIDAIVAKVRDEVKVVRYEVKDKHEVRVVPGLKHLVFDETLDILTAGQNPWLYGPSGTGKTSMAAQLAEALGTRYAGISASPGMSGAEFDGWLLPIGDGGKFEHVESVFLDFIENGGLFLIDEIANLPPDVASKLNMLIANKRAWISKRFEKPEVNVHSKFFLLAADNTSGRGGDRRFVRQQQDSALRNRFTFVRVGYDTNMERELFGTDKPWLDKVWDLRSKAEKAKLTEEVGLRQIAQGFALRGTHGKDRWNLDRCVKTITAGWSDDDRAKVGVAV